MKSSLTRAARWPFTAAIAIVLSACTAGNREPVGAAAPATTTPGARPSPRPSTDSPSAQAAMDHEAVFNQAIETLLAADLSDIGFVERHFQVRLRKQSDNGAFTFLDAEGGRFAGLAVSRVELRRRNTRPADCMLVIELAEPGPDAPAFARKHWTQPDFTPPSPHASASPAYWGTRRHGARVSIGHSRDRDPITSVVIDRIPEPS